MTDGTAKKDSAKQERRKRIKRVRETARKGVRLSLRAVIAAYDRLIRGRATPHQIALGAAIGIFVAWTPTIGFQMAIAVPACIFLKANPLSAIPPIWITNPVTAVPIYGFNYRIGRFILGGPTFREFGRRTKEVFHAMSTDGVWSGVESLLDVGAEVLAPLITGSVIVGLILAFLLYPLTFYSVKWIRSRRNHGTA